jgi:hypothetical protein
MADEGDVGWRGSCLGCSGILLVFLAVISVGIALDERDFDPDHRCERDESKSCLSSATGSIEATAPGLFDGDVVVLYDDGRRRAHVSLDGQDRPPAGSRVRIEWWEEDIVALVDLSDERRFKTYDWPDPWWEWVLFFAFCALSTGVAVGLVFGVAALRGRRRRHAG